MLHNKLTKTLSEVKSDFADNDNKANFFLGIIDELKLGKLHAVFSNVKEKGINPLFLIRILIVLPFCGQDSVNKFTKSYLQSFFNIGKDTYYRLKNNPKVNWRTFLFGVVKLLLATIEDREKDSSNQSSVKIY